MLLYCREGDILVLNEEEHFPADTYRFRIWLCNNSEYWRLGRNVLNTKDYQFFPQSSNMRLLVRILFDETFDYESFFRGEMNDIL